MPTSDLITLILAHPLSAAQAARLHATDVKDYRAGEKISVPERDARSIINAGFAKGVEPGDHEQVAAALNPSKAKPAAKTS